MTKFVNCPFCGGDKMSVHYDLVDCSSVYVECNRCHARGPEVQATVKHITENYNSAIELWNNRDVTTPHSLRLQAG